MLLYIPQEEKREVYDDVEAGEVRSVLENMQKIVELSTAVEFIGKEINGRLKAVEKARKEFTVQQTLDFDSILRKRRS
jgi:hypothetical protein